MIQIAIVLAAILLVIGVQLLRAFLAFVFPVYGARALSAGTPAPPALADLFERAHEELSALGFEGPTWFLKDPDPANGTTVKIHAVYRHPRDGAMFWLFPPVNSIAPNRLGAYVASRLDDGRVAISQAYDVYFVLTATPDALAQAVAPGTLRMHYEGHRGWLAGFAAAPDPTFVAPESILDFAGPWHNRQRAQLLARGDLWCDAAGVARPRFWFALRMLVAYLRRPKPPKDPNPVPAARLTTLAAVAEQVRERVLPARAQWYLFAASAVLFAVLGALVWSPRSAVLILVVIGIHESGHYLAMRAFGYRNVHMLALPLIGGVTIGQEVQPSASKRAWMSLMGPLPGILIGWMLMFGVPMLEISPGIASWCGDAAITFLLINYINLLPIPPLDGAAVVQAMLPPRWHNVQAGFIAVTCVGGAIGAIVMGMTAIAVLALLQLATLPLVLQNGRALKALLADGVPPRSQAHSLRLRRVFDLFERIAGPSREARKRITQAEAVLRAADQPPMRWWERTILASVLTALLVVPMGSVALVLFAIQPHLSTEAKARVEAIQAEQAQFAQQAHAMSLADLAREFKKSDVHGADDAALHDAETRLGQPLPDDVATILRSVNGIDAIRLGPVEQVGRADRAQLESIAQQGVISVMNISGADAPTPAQVPLERAAHWIRLGRSSEERVEQLYLDADATPAIPGQRVIRVVDEGAYSYVDLRTLLESDWVMQRTIKSSEERRKVATRSARESLRTASVQQLLTEFEQPGLFARLASHDKGWPPAAAADAIAVAEQRLSLSFPGELAELYRQHDGLPPLQILDVASLAYTDAWPASQGNLEVPSNIKLLDFTVFDQDGQSAATTHIDKADIQHCVVIAASSYPPGSDVRVASPSVWWCRGSAGEADRWIALRRGIVYPSFRSFLIDAAAMRRANRVLF